MMPPTFNIPTIFSAFGATGDLMRRKVVPSLFYLFERNELPSMFRIYGFSRRGMTDTDFQSYVREAIEEHSGTAVAAESLTRFCDLFRFQQGTFEEAASYDELKRTFNECDREWGVCSNKLFYLAVAPEFYETILTHIARSGLSDPCDEGQGWTRVIVEKPFGVDSATAKEVDALLARLFKEEQIYRIDHYLGKEMLQNILTFRFSNNLFEIPWGNQLIEKIEIRLFESIGVEKRGAFYDPVGALRDVGQNHILQMLALVVMEHPESFEATAIQKKRTEAIKLLDLLSHNDAVRQTFRAQYEGYRSIQGVPPDSMTETYFKIKAFLDSPKWERVPITMESGKRMGEALKEIVIMFRHPTPCLCPNGMHHKNEVIIRLEPKEEILIEFWSKKPGFAFETEQRMFHFLLREQVVRVQYVEEYAKLLLDCVRGDQTLFISTEEITAMWRFIDPILEAWKTGDVPLETYTPDTREVLEKTRHLD